MKPTTLLAAALAAACLAVPATASAGTVSADGSAVAFTGTAAAETLLVDIDFDGNASFSVSVDAGPGCQPERLRTDHVPARRGRAREQDQIACGPGVDTVRADRQDVVQADCEKVVRGGSAPQGKACAVPKLRGVKLKAAKRKLATAGCKAKSGAPRIAR